MSSAERIKGFRLSQRVIDLVAEWPPMTPEQRSLIGVVISGSLTNTLETPELKAEKKDDWDV